MRPGTASSDINAIGLGEPFRIIAEHADKLELALIDAGILKP